MRRAASAAPHGRPLMVGVGFIIRSSMPMPPPQSHDAASDSEWLRAEFAHVWTTQSDINGRLVSVYVSAMTIGFALLAALGAWAASDSAKNTLVSPYLRLFLFLIPSTLALAMFLHNLAQRREVVLLGGYWRVFIEPAANRSTWAKRVEVFRKVHRRWHRQIAFLASANQPIPLSYAALFVASCVVGSLTFLLSPPIEHSDVPAIICSIAYTMVGVAHLRIARDWDNVLGSEFDRVKTEWTMVRSLEERQRLKPLASNGPDRRHHRRRANDA